MQTTSKDDGTPERLPAVDWCRVTTLFVSELHDDHNQSGVRMSWRSRPRHMRHRYNDTLQKNHK
jgi:hypothetical protein